MKQLIDLKLNEEFLEGPYITITQSSSLSSSSYPKDRINFKNSMDEAKRIFKKEHSTLDFDPYQKHLLAVSEDLDFWKQGSNGVQVIVSSKEAYTFRLRYPVRESGTEIQPSVVVDDIPYILPLLLEKQNKSHYYIMALNRDSFQLFEVLGEEVNKVELPEDAPLKLDDAIRDHRDTGSLRFRSQGTAGASFHGHDGAEDEREADRENYFNLIDRYLRENERINTKIPLRLYALSENRHKYFEISKLENLDRKLFIDETPTKHNIKNISSHAIQLTDDYNDNTSKEMARKINAYQSEKRVLTSTDANNEVVDTGVIDTLVLMGKRLETPDKEVNQLAHEVLKKGGKVFVMVEEKIIGSERVVSILRYPLKQ